MIISIDQRATLLFAAAVIAGSANAGFVLDNGPGNASVEIDVDGYGGFGFGLFNGADPDNVFPGAGRFQNVEGVDADIGPFSATFIGFGGLREALTSGAIFGNGNQSPVLITDDNGTAVSSFIIPAVGLSQPALLFNLRQSLQPLFTGIARTGTVLNQHYSITNQSDDTDASFDLVRYLDADLSFDTDSVDGGGVNNVQGDNFTFITDIENSEAGTIGTTFAGLDADNSGANGFIGSEYIVGENDFVLDDIIDGFGLGNAILNDTDGDGFVDPGSIFNLATAYGSSYVLNGGGSTTFLARTIFGSGAPAEITPNPPVIPDPVPSPASILLMLFAALGFRKRR